MAAKSQGTLIKIGANSIAEVTGIGDLDLTKEAKDVSNLASTWREFLSTGLLDGGEIPVSGFFNPNDTLGQKAMYDLFVSGALSAFSILLVSLGADFSFNGIVTGFKITGIDMEGNYTFEGKIRTSGVCTLGLTASGGLSGLALTGTGGTISPAFGAAVRYYTFGGVTAASVTVTPTAASHTIKLFVDGVYTQDIVSGAASGAITMAIGTKKLTLVAYEAGKAQQVTEIIVVKVS